MVFIPRRVTEFYEKSRADENSEEQSVGILIGVEAPIAFAGE
jgi:hypothetical protein